MPPSQLLDFSSRLMARVHPDGRSLTTPLEAPDSLNPTISTQRPTTDKKLSTAAGAAIVVIFVVLVFSLFLTICLCLRRSKRRERAREAEKKGEIRVDEVELASTIGDGDSTIGIVKGEVKKPQRVWLPWRR
jgi:flagellar biosynthesis/type III secretory pathway M-ring protein FliF/YscJ